MRNVMHLKGQDHNAETVVDQNMAQFAERKLALFAQNCRVFAERVAVGQLRLIDAADMLQSAAELSRTLRDGRGRRDPAHHGGRLHRRCRP